MPKPIEAILKEVRVGELDLQTDHRIAPGATLADAYRAFDTRSHGAVMVCEGDRVVGIFTDRDVLYRTALEGLPDDTEIREVMSARPVTVSLDQRLSDAIAVMVNGRYRHLPVVDDEGNQIGLLSSRVILRFIADHFPEAFLNLPPRLDQTHDRPEGG